MATVSETTVVEVVSAVDSNWRGAYDILVRPAGARLDLESTNGLVEPDFLSFSGTGGISLDQLAQVRSIRGVELAAPVGFVGYVRYTLSSPVVHLPAPPAVPTLFRFSVSAYTGDGVDSVLVQRQTGEILMGPPDADGQPGHWATDFGGLTSGSGPGGNVSTIASSNRSLPAVVSPIMAVDPAAEEALLGPSSAFLRSFQRLDKVGRTVGAFDPGLVPSQFTYSRFLLRSAREDSSAAGRPVVPLVVSNRLYAPLRLELTVEQLGHPLKAYPNGAVVDEILRSAEELAGPGATPLGRSTNDLSDALRPLQLAEISVTWPGATKGDSVTSLTALGGFSTQLADRPTYRSVPSRLGSTSRLAFEIDPMGVVGPDGDPATAGPPIVGPPQSGEVANGREEAYRRLRGVPFAVPGVSGAPGFGAQPFYFAPIGDFDLTRLVLPSNPLNYVPLGAYDPPQTLRVADADGTSTHQTMSPTLNPAGLILVPPLAITDLAGARVLRGERPIDAIRLRVANVRDFGPEGRAQIERVAAAIADLGLDVDVVAGASPQEVEAYVPAYFQADGSRDLGWIQQPWTTLGASERVSRGLTEGTIELLWLGILSGAIWAIAMQLIQASSRRREIALLLGLGWRLRSVWWWLVAESLAVATAVAVAGAGAWLVTGRGAAGVVAVVAVVATIIATPVVAVGWSLRTVMGSTGAALARGDLSTRVIRALDGTTIAGFAVRDALARPTRSLALGGALATAGASLAVAIGGVVSTAERVGPTLLASALTDMVRPAQIAVLSMTAITSVTAVILLIRLGARERATEERSLASLGWSRREIVSVRTLGGLVISLPAAIASGCAALAILRIDPILEPGATIVEAAAITVALGVLGAVMGQPRRAPA
jgi:hypothetical protein